MYISQKNWNSEFFHRGAHRLRILAFTYSEIQICVNKLHIEIDISQIGEMQIDHIFFDFSYFFGSKIPCPLPRRRNAPIF